MKSSTYKKIRREYFSDLVFDYVFGWFIAEGLQADGHLAYSRLDDQGNVIPGEETCYIQVREYGRLYMLHI